MVVGNLTQYGPNYLSELVFNTKELYDIRHKDMLMLILDIGYTYTEKQKEILIQDLKGDLEETLELR